ncbi:MAG: LysR substrate-binding domain-containing protein [Leptolyngbya sp.]|nr:LysR substrate-binding domain-containing protein [Leptolyngbya sp.]
MEIYQIQVFLEVARCLSFTEAADTLNLTQPAVSAKIKSLEAELETPLFHRLGRRIELTQVGEYLLAEGPQLLDLEQRLKTEIEEIKQGKNSVLTIGSMADVMDHWLPSVLYDYRRLYPAIQTRCVQFNSAEELYRAIKAGDVDLGISDLSYATFDDLAETPIDSVHYSLAVSASHRLAQQPWLSLQELKDESWVLLPEGSPSRIMLQKRMQELGLDLSDFTHVEVVDSLSQVRTYLMQGHYLSFVSDFELHLESQAGLIRHVPLEEFALGSPLFLLMAKRLSRALEASISGSSSGLSLESVRQFTALLKMRQASRPQRFTPFATALASSQSAATSSRVPQFQAPTFLVRSVSPSGTDTIRLTIGTQNRTIQTITAGLIIQRLGLLEHFLPRSGRYSGTRYQIRWADYSSGAPIVEGLQTQQIDIGILGDYPLLLSALPGAAETACTRLISFVASNPDGTGNDIIVPQQSSLNCIEDLAGRVIAVPFGSAAHGMVMRSLHHCDLLDAVTLTTIDACNHCTRRPVSSLNNVIDGYAYFAPFHEIAKHRGQFRRLLSQQLDGLPTFHGVVIRDELADQYPEIAVAYLRALLAAQYWYATQPIAPTLVSRWVNMDAAIVSKTLLSSTSDPVDAVYHPETQLRADWLQAHIQALSQIAGQENLGHINLNGWMQPEFLAAAVAAL